MLSVPSFLSLVLLIVTIALPRAWPEGSLALGRLRSR